jgi:hypothetical protein
MRRLLPLLVFSASCGRPGSSESVASTRRDAAAHAPDAAVVLAPLALGMPALSAFAYRTRAGHAPFQLARQSEAAGDWVTVAAQCRQALAVDPDHLDAAYLLAVALAKTGAGGEQIVTPLAKAVAADYGKWGAASLEQPALQPFLATAIGQAWRRRVDEERPAFLAALARALVVTSSGDLYAYDGEAIRWYRLTRTGGAVVAALRVRSRHQLAYVTRQRVKEGGKSRTKIGIGLVDLAAGHTRRAVAVPAEVPASATLRIGYSEKKPAGFVVRAGTAAWQLVDTGKLELRRLPAKAHADVPAYLADMVRLEVSGRSARIDRTAVANVSADWDDSSLASAIKIGRSKKVVTVPSPGLIDGDTATWSPDGTQLAFVAQLSETCAPGLATAAAFVADGATGTVQELERATTGIAIEWYADRKLAIAGDHGVSIVALDGGAATPLAGADGLATPRWRPKCVPEPIIEEPIVDDEEAATGEPSDAGVDAP